MLPRSSHWSTVGEHGMSSLTCHREAGAAGRGDPSEIRWIASSLRFSQ